MVEFKHKVKERTVYIIMYGFGKRNKRETQLTEKEIREQIKNMSRSERKEFKRRLEQAEADRDWDMFMLLDLFDD